MSNLTTFLASDAYALAVVSFGVFIDLLVYSSFIPVLPDIVTKQLGGGPAETGLLIASYAAGLLIGAPVLGVLSDKYQQRKAGMIFGLVGLIISTALYGLAQGYPALVVARIFQGVSGAAVWTLGLSLLADKFPREKLGPAMGTVVTSQVAGTLLGPPLGGLAYKSGGIWGVAGMCMGAAVLDLVLRLLVIEKKALHYDEGSAEVICKEGSAEQMIVVSADCVGVEELSAETISRPPTKAKAVPTSVLLRNRLLVLTALTTVLLSALITSFEPILPIFLEETFEFDQVLVGLSFLAFGIPSAISSIVAGFLLDRLGPRMVTIPSAVVGAASIGALSLFTTNLPMTLVFFGMVGATLSICVIPLLPNVVDAVEGAGGKLVLNRAYAVFNMAWSLGILLGPLSGGALLEYVGYKITMICLGVAALLVIPVEYFAFGSKSQSQPQPQSESL